MVDLDLPTLKQRSERLALALGVTGSDGRVLISAFDSGIALSCYTPDDTLTVQLPVDSANVADWIVDGKMLAEFVSSARGSSIRLEVVAERLVIKSDSGKMSLPLYPKSSWFAFEHVEDNPAVWPANAPALLKKVTHAVSQRDSGGVHRGIALGGGTAAATDGDRLSVVDLPIGIEETIVVPPTAMHMLDRLHDEGSTLHVRATTQRLTFVGETWKLTTNLIEGEFRDWRNVVPARSTPCIEVKRDEILSSLRKLRLIAGRDSSRKILLESADGGVRLWSELPDIGEQEEIVAGSCLIGPIAFNIDNLYRAIKHLPDEDVSIEMGGPSAPAVVRGDGYLAVVMPIRVQRSP